MKKYLNLHLEKSKHGENQAIKYRKPTLVGFCTTPAARGLEELFSAVLERFLQPIHALRVLQELGWKYIHVNNK
jgi:hypothetical protein